MHVVVAAVGVHRALHRQVLEQLQAGGGGGGGGGEQHRQQGRRWERDARDAVA